MCTYVSVCNKFSEIKLTMIWIHGEQNNVDLIRQANFISKHNTYAAGQAKIQKRREAINSSQG